MLGRLDVFPGEFRDVALLDGLEQNLIFFQLLVDLLDASSSLDDSDHGSHAIVVVVLSGVLFAR